MRLTQTAGVFLMWRSQGWNNNGCSGAQYAVAVRKFPLLLYPPPPRVCLAFPALRLMFIIDMTGWPPRVGYRLFKLEKLNNRFNEFPKCG